jgi:DNA-binding CsgD family transcriptional regulator
MFLLEREAPLVELERLAPGSVVAVIGDAGIGKSSLLEAFADGARNTMRVFAAGCEALFTPRPLGPLFDLANELDIDLDMPRERLFPAVLASLRCAPSLLIIEDVHWADRATLDLLKYLGRRIARTSVVLAISYRDDEIASDHPLISVLGDVPMRRVRLSPLSREAVEQLGATREVYELTGGNPFYVTEVLASGGQQVPPTVRDAVLARFAKLDDESRRWIEIASLIPGRAEIDLIGGEPRAPNGIVRVEQHSIVFRHELGRRAIEGSISDTRRTPMHRMILDRLIARGERSLARLAHHAAGARDAASILRFAPLAAIEAAKASAHREAASHYRTALQYCGEDERAPLLESLAYECYLTEQLAEALERTTEALPIWRARGEKLREGDNLRWQSRLSWFSGRNADARQCAAEAIAILEASPPGRELAMAYSNQAQLHMLANEHEEALRWGARAIALAEDLDDQEILAHALNNVGVAEDRDEKIERSLRIALEHGHQEHAARAYTNLGTNNVRRCEYEAAARWLDEGIAYCRDRDLDSWMLYMRAWRARLHFERGMWDDAAAEAHAVIGYRGTSAVSRIPALAVLGRIRARRGDPGAMELLDEARDLAAQTGEFQRLAPVAAARAEAAWLRGDLEIAKEEAREAHTMSERTHEPWTRRELELFLLPSSEFHHPQRPYENAFALAKRDDIESLQEAVSILERLGDATLLAIVKQKLRARGVRGPRGSTRANPFGLTDREVEIVHLIDEGLRNTEIAARLYVSPKTVDHHVSSVLSKLGAKNRRDAARQFREARIEK